MPDIEAHEQNRKSWNVATARHNLHKGDQAAFFRAGGNTLYREETKLLGDIRGASLVHLQCNCGQDTLSIARHLGASVTGVDISDEAINFARELSAGSGIPATFHRSDIFTWCENPDAPKFDIAFVSYGTVNWLGDLARWAQGVANILHPGGRLVFIDYHPAIMMFSESTDAWELEYDYLGGQLISDGEGVGDYVGEASGQQPAELPPFENPHYANAYPWGVAETIMPLVSAGLTIEHFEEYPYSNGWKVNSALVQRDGRRFYMPDGRPNIAMMFSCVARKR
ncbi:MAG: class I SAM-dependent methyltransferase [Verrucomicrobiales bacterium]